MTMITEQIRNFAKESLANLIQRYNATIRLVDHSDVSEETILLICRCASYTKRTESIAW